MSKSQLAQDQHVIEFYKQKQNGYFVEIGASDGVSLSNTYLLEKTYNWKGICVEPLPNEFSKLKHSRSAICCNKAIYNTSDRVLKFVIKECSLCSGILEALDESVKIDNIIYKRGPNDNVHSIIDVTTITLNDLLISSNAPHFIEYLSLDTEGSELEVLKSVDLNTYTFGIIDVEHNYVEPRRTQIRNLLESHNYMFHSENKFDDHYIHRSLL
jgi:FkbM family methyltransferase